MTDNFYSLEAGQFITAELFSRAYDLRVLEGKDLARALENGHEDVFVVNPGTCITDNREYNLRKVAEERLQKAQAVTVQTGDRVIIRGVHYRVKVVGEKYCDPIHFIRV